MERKRPYGRSSAVHESGSEPSADAAERVRALNRSGNLDDLWPGFSEGERRDARRRIKAVVEAVLAGGEPARTLVVEDPHGARCIGVAAFAAGMGPLLGHWIERGRVEASEEVRALLAEHLDHGRRRIAMLRGWTVTIARALREAGAQPILLKGMHLGTEYFPDPSTRPASDIDLLLTPSEISTAATVLAALGFEETLHSAFGRRSTWTHASAPRGVRSVEMDVADNPWTVDVHDSLERWYFRGVKRELGSGVFETTRTVNIEGESIRVLDQPWLVAFLALHTSYHLRNTQLVRLLELIWVMRRDGASGRLTTGELDALLDRTRTGRFAYPALALAEDLAPGTVDRRLLDRLATEVSPRMRRVLDKVRRQEIGPLNERSADILFAWAVGPRELAANALEIVFPSDDAIGKPLRVLGRRLGMVLRNARSRAFSRPRARDARGRVNEVGGE